MKGYFDSTSKILYVFDTPDTIPYVDESCESIAVYPHYVEAFKKDNPDYASIIYGYNFDALTVRPKPFNGHTNDTITTTQPPVVKTDPVLFYTLDGSTPESVFTYDCNPENVPANIPYIYNPSGVVIACTAQRESGDDLSPLSCDVNPTTGELSFGGGTPGATPVSYTITVVSTATDTYNSVTTTLSVVVEDSEIIPPAPDPTTDPTEP